MEIKETQKKRKFNIIKINEPIFRINILFNLFGKFETLNLRN